VDLGTIIGIGIVLALLAPLFRGLAIGLRGSPRAAASKPPAVGPLVEVKLVGLSEPPSSSEIELFRDFLTVRSIDFCGQGSKSPNGKYLVGSQDSDYRGGANGGYRSKGYGRVVLLDGSQVIWQIDLERPNDAVVADNGTVAVNDWRFGDGLKGTFYIIDRSGRKFGHSTRANLLKCGISKDGALTWCTTASSDYEPDDCMTFIFSTSPPNLLFKAEGNLEIDDIFSTNNEIHLKKKGITERYDFSGKLLNPEEVDESWYKHTLEHGSPFELLSLARGILYGKEKGDVTEAEAQEIGDVIDKILKMAGIDDDYHAQAYRLLGELAEAQGDIQVAVKHYRTALTYNPKVGVLRTLSRLEKQLSKN